MCVCDDVGSFIYVTIYYVLSLEAYVVIIYLRNAVIHWNNQLLQNLLPFHLFLPPVNRVPVTRRNNFCRENPPFF